MRMIRFYAVTGWDTLRHLGYEWWMRMDDDSFFLSNIDYNVFDAMRGGGYVYGFRALSRECDRMFGAFVDVYREDHGLPPLLDDGTIFCERVPKHCSRDGRPLRRQTRRAASRCVARDLRFDGRAGSARGPTARAPAASASTTTGSYLRSSGGPRSRSRNFGGPSTRRP